MSLLGRCSLGGGNASRRVLLVAMCTVGLVLGFSPVASAQTTPYFQVGSFDSGATVAGVAVDQSSNEVYIAQAASGITSTVQRFSSSGGTAQQVVIHLLLGTTYSSAGVAVDPANEDVYEYTTNDRINTYDCANYNGSNCTEVGSGFSVTGPSGAFVQIASDQAGDVYYPNQTADTVQEFDASGNLLNTFTGAGEGGFTKPQGVAVDANGDVYVADAGRVVEIAGSGGQPDPSGAESVLDTGDSQDVSVDPVTGDVFVLDLDATSGCGSLPSPCYQVVGYHSDGTQFAEFGAGAIQNNGAGNPPDHVAVDDATGNVYVSDYKDGVLIFSPHVPPTVTPSQPSGVTATGATLNGTVNPNGTDTHYFFEYGLSTSYGQDSPTPPPGTDAGSGSSPVAVSATLSGLEPDKTYDYQLVASSTGGTVQGGNQTFQTSAAAPSVGGEASIDVTQTDALVQATVNPNNQDTKYYFEDSSGALGPCPAKPAQTGTDIGSSFGGQQVSQPFSGLGPDTSFHYRVVAYNDTGVSCGPDQTFQTLAAAPQAAERAFELVSSDPGTATDYSHDQEFEGLSPDGQTALILADRGSSQELFTATRGQSGWQQSALPTGTAIASGETFPDFPAPYGISDTGGVFYSVQNNLANPFPTNVFSSSAAGTALVSHDQAGDPVNVSAPNAASCTGCAVSADGTRFVFQASGALTAGANGSVTNVYESDAQGRLTLVSAPSAGDPAPATAASSALGVNYNFDARHPDAGQFVAVNFAHAVSDGGTYVWFSTAEQLDPSMPDDGDAHLYLRDVATDTTRLVSRSQVAGSQADSIVTYPTSSTDKNVAFGGATPDGSEGFFLSVDRLTSDAPTADGTPHLYEYDTSSGRLSYVAHAVDGSASAGQQAFVAVSDDGSELFFTDTAQLTNSAPADRNPKLYAENLTTGNTEYVEEFTPDPGQLQVSGNGQTLLFDSTADLTPDATDSLPHVYLWRAGSGLSLISKGIQGAAGGDFGVIGYVEDHSSTVPGQGAPFPAGQAGAGENVAPSISCQSYSVGGAMTSDGLRALSADGSWAFFSSYQQLTPDASPTQFEGGSCSARADWKIYAWHAGELSLISPAGSADPAFYQDSSANGADVYFLSRDALAPQPADMLSGSEQVYDARLGGGFPAASNSTGPCPENACDAPPPPPAPVAGTVSFAGPGNQQPTPTPSATTAKVKVSAKTFKGSAFTLNVKIPAKGTVTITGRSVAKVARSFGKAGTYKLTVKLTTKAKRTVKRKKKMKITVKVAYKPASGKSSSVSVPMTVKA